MSCRCLFGFATEWALFSPLHRLLVLKLFAAISRVRIPNYATGLRHLSQVSEKTLSFLTKQEKI
jgi:hypothetical protein